MVAAGAWLKKQLSLGVCAIVDAAVSQNARFPSKSHLIRLN